MNTNPDQPDFEALRRLLKLKRHELPPPRYFNEFSGQVLNRLQAERSDVSDNLLIRLAERWPWLQSILAIFQNRTVVAGTLGAAVCTLLLFGVIFDDLPVSVPAASGLTGPSPQTPGQLAPVFAGNALSGERSTAPVTSLNSTSIFDAIKIEPHLVDLRPGGN